MIGERLYDLRKDAGLTQDELAEILHINKHSISSYERDKSEPPDSIKIAIAEYFNVSVDYLMGIIDSPSPIHRNDISLRLPAGFPQKLIPEVTDFINFLMAKQKKEKQGHCCGQ